MRDGFVKTASGTPEVKVADCGYNTQSCLEMIRQAQQQGVKVLCLPELVIPGYTCGDLFFQNALLKEAVEGIKSLVEFTKGKGIKVTEIEMTKSNNVEDIGVAVLFTMKLEKKHPHAEIIQMLSQAEGVRFIEEL